MSGLEIVELDPHDRVQVDAWHAVYLAAELALPPGVASPWMLEEMRVEAQDQGGGTWRRGYCGLVDGDLVAASWLELPQRDNPDLAYLQVHVRPDRQRHGHGSLLLAHLEEIARDRGRTVLTGEGAWAYEVGPDGVGQPAPEFARRHGYALALGDVKRRLALPVDPQLLERLAAEAAPYHQGFELRSWEGPVPDELIEGWAELVSTLNTEAPQGDLVLEDESADPAVVRDNEALLALQGRTKYNTVALSPGGELVAYTDLVTTVHDPGLAYQWGTLVRRDARGHRLGVALKAANLGLLQRRRPDIREVITYNAEVNAHMIGVNEQLGFAPVARLGEFQKRL